MYQRRFCWQQNTQHQPSIGHRYGLSLLDPSDPAWSQPKVPLRPMRQHTCVSGRAGRAQSARCPSCLMSVRRGIAGAHEGRGPPDSWGLRRQLSTDLSEMKRTDNSRDFTFFLLGERSVLNYSWQPQQPPHLALSGLNLITFGIGNNTPSLSPQHLGHKSKAASFGRSSKEQERYRGKLLCA